MNCNNFWFQICFQLLFLLAVLGFKLAWAWRKCFFFFLVYFFVSVNIFCNNYSLFSLSNRPPSSFLKRLTSGQFSTTFPPSLGMWPSNSSWPGSLMCSEPLSCFTPTEYVAQRWTCRVAPGLYVAGVSATVCTHGVSPHSRKKKKVEQYPWALPWSQKILLKIFRLSLNKFFKKGEGDKRHWD